MLFFRRFAVGLLLVEAFVGRDSPCAVATVSGASNGATSGASNGGSRRRRQQQQREEQRRQRASDAGSRLSSSPSPRYMHVSPRSSLFEASSSLNTSAGATSCGDTGAASPIASTLQSSVSRLASSSHRRACGLYVWDAPSAFLHAWCNRLMRDCVYEGRGGRKVRVRGNIPHMEARSSFVLVCKHDDSAARQISRAQRPLCPCFAFISLVCPDRARIHSTASVPLQSIFGGPVPAVRGDASGSPGTAMVPPPVHSVGPRAGRHASPRNSDCPLRTLHEGCLSRW
jgi:hypothetical protein